MYIYTINKPVFIL